MKADELIRTAMLARGWNSSDLAKACGWTDREALDVCRGTARLDTKRAKALSAALGHSASWWIEMQRLDEQRRAKKTEIPLMTFPRPVPQRPFWTRERFALVGFSLLSGITIIQLIGWMFLHLMGG